MAKTKTTRVSIHTPAWGVTQNMQKRIDEICFNPHARMGRDRSNCFYSRRPDGFNPHARMGRDRVCTVYAQGALSFNPHARMGRDRLYGNA